MILVYSYEKHGHLPLTKHFKVREFACINKQDGRIVDGKRMAVGELVSDEILIDSELITLLEQARIYFDAPITIQSGYRTPAYNRAVGGAPASQHMEGRAADITVEGVSPDKVWEWADSHNSQHGVGRYTTFTHVDKRVTGRKRWDLRR